MDIKPTKQDILIATRGIYTQLSSCPELMAEYHSVANAVEKLGLYGFIDNQVKVMASSVAWQREADRRLHIATESGTYSD